MMSSPQADITVAATADAQPLGLDHLANCHKGFWQLSNVGVIESWQTSHCDQTRVCNTFTKCQFSKCLMSLLSAAAVWWQNTDGSFDEEESKSRFHGKAPAEPKTAASNRHV